MYQLNRSDFTLINLIHTHSILKICKNLYVLIRITWNLFISLRPERAKKWKFKSVCVNRKNISSRLSSWIKFTVYIYIDGFEYLGQISVTSWRTSYKPLKNHMTQDYTVLDKLMQSSKILRDEMIIDSGECLLLPIYRYIYMHRALFFL